MRVALVRVKDSTYQAGCQRFCLEANVFAGQENGGTGFCCAGTGRGGGGGWRGGVIGARAVGPKGAGGGSSGAGTADTCSEGAPGG